MFDFLSRWSIRKALNVLAICAVCPALVIICISGLTDYERFERDSRNTALYFAQSLASQQREVAESARGLLTALASVPELIECIHKKHPDFLLKNEILANVLENNLNYHNVVVMNAAGDVVCSGVPAPSTNNYDRRYFCEAMRTHRFSAGEYVTSHSSADPVFHYSMPIFDGNKKIIGVIAVSLKLNWFDRSLNGGEKVTP